MTVGARARTGGADTGEDQKGEDEAHCALWYAPAGE
jgi:hypothetical protein